MASIGLSTVAVFLIDVWRPTQAHLTESERREAADKHALLTRIAELELQLQRLKAVRGTRNLTEARAIYVDEKQAVVDTEGNVDYVGVDRMLAREDALAPGTETGAADPMDDVD